ncbi:MULTISPECIES: nucleotide exchange factor GrpE [unclassified Streptomyces]|uniref:nucleotide exchange factor GrpE n=1 Tax=unclassified Streptomyces TaxID=2593676 RepID=UPI002E36CA69|nr:MULTISPECIES: nucleotide exchange factor GrpE [unclassified Streptomyces]
MNRPAEPPRRERPDAPAVVVLGDRRRTGPPALTPGAPGGRPDRADPPDASERAALLAERTADLQRVKAEYDNYRKRVRRDRLAVGEAAVSNVLSGLLPVLDAVDAARALGETGEGFEAVARLLESRLAALGLEPVGEPGDPFDPLVHEAVTSAPDPLRTTPTCARILRPGYRVGTRLLRPAQVAVAVPLIGREARHPFIDREART